MPELNPRRVNSTKGRFAQVSAAVLAGMAAMFCLQNVIEFRREAALPPAPPPVAAPSAPVEPELVLPVPEGIKRQAGPVPSSMMLKPEAGLSGGEATVVGVSGEEAPPKFEYKEPPPPPGPKAKKKEMPHLKDRTMESRFASNAARTDGRFTGIKHRVAPEEAPAPAAPAPVKEAAKPVVGASGIKIIERASASLENLQPALIAQATAPEIVFWTKQRKLNVGIALVLMVLGIAYLIHASGVRDAPPERAEGEL